MSSGLRSAFRKQTVNVVPRQRGRLLDRDGRGRAPLFPAPERLATDLVLKGPSTLGDLSQEHSELDGLVQIGMNHFLIYQCAATTAATPSLTSRPGLVMVMREHRILFRGAMLRPIPDGRKAQTRRVVKPHEFRRVST